MYTISDIPALREQIFANVGVAHKTASSTGSSILGNGGQGKLEIVTYLTDNGSYVASVIEPASQNIVFSGVPELNPGMALFKLFEKSSEGVTKALESQLRKSNQSGLAKEEEKVAATAT